MIDKSINPAPAGGLAILTDADVEPVEIEIVTESEDDPPEVRVSADGMTIEFGPEELPEDIAFDDNLAEYIDDSDLGSLANTLEDEIDQDRRSRRDWEQAYIDGLKLLGLKIEDRDQPWLGACGVTHPMITEAVVKFQSETIMETFPAKGPVLTKIIGKETQEKKEAANRVRADMNYQLTEVMVEYRSEHEKMLWNLPATGSAFKKVYYDPNLGRQISLFVPAEDVLMPYGTSNLFSTHRVTHVMRKTKNELLKLIQAGFYSDVQLGQPWAEVSEIQKAKDDETGFADPNDERYTLYEVLVDLDLKGFEDRDAKGKMTGVALPYVVTFIKGAHTVLSIRRNWREDDPLKLRRQHFIHYQYIPGFGAYGFGLFHLIGGYAKSATSIIRQLVDAGTLANLPGGLKSRGLRIKGDSTPIAPGEFRDVDVASGAIRDNILPLPYKEPSQVLAALLDRIVEEGRRFAATNDLKVADMSAQAPVGTTLALLERQLKTMTAIQARTHDSLKHELKLLKDIIRDYADEDYDYDAEIDRPRARKADFSMVEVIPVSDPNAATMTQRLVQYQAVIQLSQSAPQIYDLPQLHRGMLEVLGIKNAEKLVKLPEDLKHTDPVTENMNVIMGKPVKAFIDQDHEAHLAVHQAALQDPMLMQIMGQNPNAQAMMAAAQAHIAEHVAFAYRVRMQQLLGFDLPNEDEVEEGLDPSRERMMSRVMPKAAQAVLQMNQQRAQQQQAQQQMQDPVLQLQMREMALKEKRAQIEEIKVKMEGASKADQARLAERKLALEAAERADRLSLERDRFKVESAAKADKIRLDERKQYSTEELGEQKLQVESLRIGSLSRASDAAVRQQDQKLALETMQTLRAAHGSNELGASGGAPAEGDNTETQ